MEDRGLTDEQIIKAFEVCNTVGMSCNDCPFNKNGKECSGVERLTLDLIHRLQDEIKTLLIEFKKELAEHEEFTKKAKTEIETQRKIIEYQDGFEDKLAEFEQKLEDGELVSKEWHDEQVLHLEEKVELLKINLKNEKNWGKIQTKQAVEDTAKEIFEKIFFYRNRKDTTNFDNILLNMAKDYGVEVE